MKVIDIENWNRKEHFLFFRRMDYPQYHIGADLDVTVFKAAVKKRGLAFSFALTYAAATVINQIEAFRYRIHDGNVVLYDQIHPSFTYIGTEDEYFKMVTANLTDTIETFVAAAQKKAHTQKGLFVENEEQRDDLIYITSIPWVSFTHMSHTISLNKEDAVPRVSWGKYYERDGKILLPFNIQANHAFIDGNHMGIYIEKLQRFFDTFS